MEALHPTLGTWIEVNGHTVKQITDELDLPDISEGNKWCVKVNGEIMTNGSVPNGIDRVEVVEYGDTEAVQSPGATSPVSDTGGDSG